MSTRTQSAMVTGTSETDYAHFKASKILKNSMYESIILPQDRDLALFNNEKDTESTLYNSYLDTDSLFSSCMLTSESFYAYEDAGIKSVFDETGQSLPARIQIACENVEETLKETKFYSDLQLFVPLQSKSEFRVRNFFKICFDTEFSDEESSMEDESVKEKKSSILKISKETPNRNTNLNNPIKVAKTYVENVYIKDDPKQIKTIVGTSYEQAIQSMTISQLQKLVKDLMLLIERTNMELLNQLPQREDFLLQNEINQYKFENLVRIHKDYPTDVPEIPENDHAPSVERQKFLQHASNSKILRISSFLKIKLYIKNFLNG